MEFFGFSKLKYRPDRWAFRHSTADISAMSVSNSTFLFLDGGSPSKTDGIPLGCKSLRKGIGAFSTPGMGRSLALLKVPQFGAQC